jgi:hypothetical protein
MNVGFPTYFPRGEGPLVSILIPTRGRPALLEKAVRSLRSPAAEILVRADRDDPHLPTIERTLAMEEFGRHRVTLITGDRGRGYGDLHLMYDELARAAKGDWLWMLNDDIELMGPPDWHELVRCVCPPHGFAGGPRVCLMNCMEYVEGRLRESPIFPMIRREAYLHLGRFSGNAYNDLWLNSVYQRLNAVMSIGIQVRHLRDQMPAHDEAVISQREQGGAAIEQWKGQGADVDADAAKLRELL